MRRTKGLLLLVPRGRELLEFLISHGGAMKTLGVSRKLVQRIDGAVSLFRDLLPGLF